MYKVVVVDDEARQSRGLKNILMQSFKGVKAEAFTEAESAMEYIRNEKVRIVITDICMPEIDGLELTKRIKDEDGGAKIILLTGFAEFEYARKAITLGAFDYLLKPLNPDKLKEVLDRAVSELDAEAVLNAQHEHMQKQLDMTLPVYMEKLLNQWVYGWASEEEKKEIEKIIPVGKNGFIIATRLWGLHKLQMTLEKEQFKDRKNQIIWWMRQLFQKPYHTLSFFSQIVQETMITVVTYEGEINELPPCFKYRRLNENMPEFLKKNGQDELKITIGIGNIYSDLPYHVEQCYKSAVNVLQYGFYFPDTQVLKASYLLPRQIKQINISLAEEELIKEALRDGDRNKAEDALEAILERCINNGYPEPKHLKISCENLLRHVSLSLQSELIWFSEETDSADDTYDTLVERAKAYLAALAEEVNLKKAGKNTEFGVKFQNYLNTRYKDDISLDNIAEHFHLTPAYFSALVKEVTGTSFSKSLIQVRINKAKEMLRETDRKIYTIAKENGFNDVKYFNRVFKKEIGITPIQYREDLKGMREE